MNTTHMVVLWQHKRSMAMDGRRDVDGKMNITDVYCLLITLTCTLKAELRRAQLNGSAECMWKGPLAAAKQPWIGNLRSYDGNGNENVTMKLNFALS